MVQLCDPWHISVTPCECQCVCPRDLGQICAMLSTSLLCRGSPDVTPTSHGLCACHQTSSVVLPAAPGTASLSGECVGEPGSQFDIDRLHPLAARDQRAGQ